MCAGRGFTVGLERGAGLSIRSWPQPVFRRGRTQISFRISQAPPPNFVSNFAHAMHVRMHVRMHARVAHAPAREIPANMGKDAAD